MCGRHGGEYGLAEPRGRVRVTPDSGRFVSVQGIARHVPDPHASAAQEQKQEWLPRMATGGHRVLRAHRAGAGSDPSSMTPPPAATADWVLNGHKKWNTNGWVTHVAIVWARTRPALRGFVVPTRHPGMRVPGLDHAWSLRAAARSELFLHDVRLPADAVLPGVEGMKGPLSCLTEARFGIAWGAVGAARHATSALNHTKERVQFGKPLGWFQFVQAKLFEMALEIKKALARAAPRPA